MPILTRIGLIHSQFENIHPFLDGNGRVGRLLITFYLYHQKVLKKPLLYLSAFFRKNQNEYYHWLNAIHEKDDIEGWLRFFMKGVIETSKEGVETAQKILLLKDKDTKKVSTLGRSAKNALLVLNNMFKNPLINLSHIVNYTGLSKSNAYALLKKLERISILKYFPTQDKKIKTYVYQDYLNLFQ